MAEILPNTSNDIAGRGCVNATLAQFKGKPRQTVVNIEDGYRIIVMDGVTLGGKFKAASLDELNAVKTTATNALTKAQGDGYYLGKAANAVSATKLVTPRTIGITGGATGTATAFDGSANINIAVTSIDASKVKGTLSVPTTGNAATATKATQDASGNVITTTYATKTEVANKSDTTYVNQQLATKEAKGTAYNKTESDTKYATKTDLTSGLKTKQPVGDYATNKALTDGLATKQPTGDYATKTELNNGLNGKANSSHSHAYVPTSGGTVTGSLTVTGTLKGGTVQATSDRRLKTNIKELESLDLASVKAYRYVLKSDGMHHVGLIAQELMKVLPEAVQADEKGFLSIDYNAVVALLVNKVQSLETRVSLLEGK